MPGQSREDFPIRNLKVDDYWIIIQMINYSCQVNSSVLLNGKSDTDKGGFSKKRGNKKKKKKKKEKKR